MNSRDRTKYRGFLGALIIGITFWIVSGIAVMVILAVIP